MIRRLLPLSVVTATVLISFIVAEIALRQFGYTPRVIALNSSWVSGWAQIDEVLGWRNREGSFRSVEPGHALMTFERDGRRVDPIAPKPESIAKVLVVGCSFTQGEGIPDDEPYSHVANRELKNLDLINYGTGGYSTYQSLLRMRSYFGAPHTNTPLVIYGIQGHHMIRNLASSEWISSLTTSDGRWLMPPHVRMSGDQMIEYKGHPLDLWPLETSSAATALAHAGVLKVMNQRPWREHHKALRELLIRMKNTTTENGGSFLIVNLVGTMTDDVEWMRREGFDYIDCQHPDVWNGEFRVGGIGHPNGLMHKWWGQCLLRALRARGYES